MFQPWRHYHNDVHDDLSDRWRPPCRQVLISADSKLPDGADKADEPSAALSGAEAAEASGAGQPALLLDAGPAEPVASAASTATASATTRAAAHGRYQSCQLDTRFVCTEMS